ncbi:MAG: hypothetical protein E6R03_12865 [Hyphomicrobiaceae bacterium]|nr:MAG: hypothetical protein E6R03_12865 [Hyphomicrobiaceae bacterium]
MEDERVEEVDTTKAKTTAILSAPDEAKAKHVYSRGSHVALKFCGLLGLLAASFVLWRTVESESLLLAGLASLMGLCSLFGFVGIQLVECPVCNSVIDVTTKAPTIKCLSCKCVSSRVEDPVRYAPELGQQRLERENITQVDSPMGCASIMVAFSLAGMFFAWVWSAPTTASAPPPPPVASAVDIGSMTPAHQLASINAGRMLAANDPSVSQFQSILDQIKRQFPSQNDTRIADQLVATWNQVKVKEPNLTLFQFSQKFASIDMHGTGK